jgi:hypothetical protein
MSIQIFNEGKFANNLRAMYGLQWLEKDEYVVTVLV